MSETAAKRCQNDDGETHVKLEMIA